MSRSTAPSPATTLPVLVADDDEAVRTTLGQILRQAGCTVPEAEDGDMALQQLERHRRHRPSAGRAAELGGSLTE